MQNQVYSREIGLFPVNNIPINIIVKKIIQTPRPNNASENASTNQSKIGAKSSAKTNLKDSTIASNQVIISPKKEKPA